MSKSVSMDILFRGKTLPEHKKKKRSMPEKSESTENLPLSLPKLEPEVDIDFDTQGRDASVLASRAISQITSNGLALTETEIDRDSDSDESDYLNNNKDDTETARRRLGEIGEFEMLHNWKLHESFKEDKEKFTVKSRKIAIVLPDENPMVTVNSRIQEIQSMVKPKAELGNFIEKLPPAQREKIKKIAEMDVNDIRREKRKNWKTSDVFNHALRITILVNKACIPRRKYHTEDKPDTAINLKRIKEKENAETVDVPLRSSLAFDMELALTTEPLFRTEKDLKNVIWVLRATKAFNQLFPIEKERELARVVAYERYDPNRIIAYQGRRPDRFYYVLTGKVQKVREYTLYSGKVSRLEGYIHKGTTSDVEELEEQCLREHHLVSKGQVEVLILHRTDFMRLQEKTLGPPIDYLRTLDLFFEFPVEIFLTNTDQIQLKYYGQDVVISDDTNRTPWIHVIKSGRVRVVRLQNVIDVHNERKFAAQKLEDLGYGRSFSHADAMLGSLFAQRKAKALRSDSVSFPEMPECLHSPLGHTIGVNMMKSKSAFSEGLGMLSNMSLTKRRKSERSEHSSVTQHKDPGKSKDLDMVSEETREIKDGKPEHSADIPYRAKHIYKKAKLIKNPIIVEPGADDPQSGRGSRADLLPEHYVIEEETDLDMRRMSIRSARSNSGVVFPPIVKSNSATPRTDVTFNGLDFKPHGTFLTREKTIAESQPRSRGRKKKKEQQQKFRVARLQLDVLTAGDIFGLEHLDPPIASEPRGVSLISDGAEVIRISKRFFLQHAQNNTMLRVETMQRDYMSMDEARTILYNKETWNQYKDVLLARMVDSIGGRHND
ncbi:hypothetical protein FSP39_010212 [Pinctada imbricata]|uniref:Cyclic nucleotide-binding domain-containing protein n=1 Tax=Pinctada imbricata TaxID=66713 RepID=A0AA89C578_PINIB|nr:hypothetical protein FSP39_010212 [Pinctada imbricata]